MIAPRAWPCAAFALVSALALLGCAKQSPFDNPEYARVCASLPVHTAEEREQAAVDGYTIDNRFDCITRESFNAIESIKAEMAIAATSRSDTGAPSQPAASTTLSAAKQGFATRVSVPGSGTALPTPPAELFIRGDYESDGRTLAAFVTPDPRDGEKHPAIVWLTGGDSSSLDEFWSAGAADNDQSASAFREAGIVMMFPTLRGGNQNAGAHEYFLGEVDDAIAAANHLARLGYVDPGQIYLGGHSTGGTLALLAAETTSRFAAVFVFGAVSAVNRYPESLVPVDFAGLPPAEQELRSPIHWIQGISTPTWVMEGEDAPGNLGELEKLCAQKNPQLRCLAVPGRNHFSVLSPATRLIAARIVGASGGRELKFTAADLAGTR